MIESSRIIYTKPLSYRYLWSVCMCSVVLFVGREKVYRVYVVMESARQYSVYMSHWILTPAREITQSSTTLITPGICSTDWQHHSDQTLWGLIQYQLAGELLRRNRPWNFWYALLWLFGFCLYEVVSKVSTSQRICMCIA